MRTRATRLMYSSYARVATTPPKRYTTGVVAVMTCAGLAIGIWIGSAQVQPRQVNVTVNPTPSVRVVIRETPVRVPTMPAACRDAVDLVQNMQDNLVTLSGASGREHDILTRARVAIMAKDLVAMNVVSQDQNALERSLSDPRRQVNDSLIKLQADMLLCKKALSASPN